MKKEVFVKEDRYLVIKRADLEAATAAGLLSVGQIGILNKILCESSRIRSNRGARPLHGLFVESDWPEYDAVLKMIADRVEGVDGADKQGPILYCIVDADGLPFMQEYCVDLDAAALQKEVDAMNEDSGIPQVVTASASCPLRCTAFQARNNVTPGQRSLIASCAPSLSK
nr:MAG: hypothetical protein [Bacteriophage sp.]